MRAYSVLFRLWLDKFPHRFSVGSRAESFKLYRLRDAITVQLATLTAMVDYAENVGISRGSALYMEKASDSFDGFTASVEGVQNTFGEIRTVSMIGSKSVVNTHPVRPMPPVNAVFETVWREYRERNEINK